MHRVEHGDDVEGILEIQCREVLCTEGGVRDTELRGFGPRRGDSGFGEVETGEATCREGPGDDVDGMSTTATEVRYFGARA